MADHRISIGGIPVAGKNIGGVEWQYLYEGPAETAAVFTVAVGTTSAVPVLAADTPSGRRQMIIQNTGGVTVYISPTQNFTMASPRFQLLAGGAFGGSYKGAVYAIVVSGTGELQIWAEG